MTIDLRTLRMLRERLEEVLAPLNVDVSSVYEDDGSKRLHQGLYLMSLMNLRRQMQNNVSIVIVEIVGWGHALERRPLKLTTGIDPAQDPEVAVDLATFHLQEHLELQANRRIIANDVGITRPLEGRDLLSTRHLIIDEDAVRTLVDIKGSREAGDWMRTQMAMHAEAMRQPRNDIPELFIQGRVAGIPYNLSPLKIGDRATLLNLAPAWEDDQICLEGHLPDCTLATITGRPIADVVSGTPIGGRIVISAENKSTGTGVAEGLALLCIQIDRRDIPFDEALKKLV